MHTIGTRKGLCLYAISNVISERLHLACFCKLQLVAYDRRLLLTFNKDIVQSCARVPSLEHFLGTLVQCCVMIT